MSAINETGSRHLAFTLGAESYALPLLTVKEVIALPAITPLPQTPSYFLGIMNLRGRVISVIDLRKKLGIQPSASAETAVIICDVGAIALGIVVDSINAVLSPSSGEISEKPALNESQATDYITGVFRQDQKLILLLDIDKALGPNDRKVLARASQTQKAA